MKNTISYLLFLFAALSFSPMVHSLGTGQCNHNKTSENVLSLISCLDILVDKHLETLITEFKKQVNENSKTYDVAKVKDTLVNVYEDVQACVTDFSKNCFKDEVTNLLTLFLDGLKPILQNVNRNDAEKSVKLEKFTQEWEKVVGDSFDETMKFLEKLFTSDKSCTIENIGETTEKEIFGGRYSCMALQIKTLEPLARYVSDSKESNERYGIYGFPKSASVCQTMDSIVNSCFVETTCISTQEMTLLKTAAVKIYQMAMGNGMKIKKAFGSIDVMVNMVKTTDFKYDDSTYNGEKILDDVDLDHAFGEKQKTKMIEAIDYVEADYNSDNCKTKVAALVQQLPAAARTAGNGAGGSLYLKPLAHLSTPLLILLKLFFNQM